MKFNRKKIYKTCFEFDDSPNLHSNLLSRSVPSFFGLCGLFLDLQNVGEQHEESAIIAGALTCFSVSEPKRAMLLSFQSYFFALTKPDILQWKKGVLNEARKRGEKERQQQQPWNTSQTAGSAPVYYTPTKGRG